MDKSLIEALDQTCLAALEQAAVASAGRGQFEVTLEDYVRTLLPSPDFQDILVQFGRSQAKIQELLEKKRPLAGQTSDRPRFSQFLSQFVQAAYMIASLEFGLQTVSTGILVLTLLRSPEKYNHLPFFKELREIPADDLQKLLTGLYSRQGATASGSGAKGNEEYLAKYTTDFTADAKAGKTDPVFARGPEIRLMVDILTRRRKNNPILVGDPGVGKTAIVEGLALRVVEGNLPDALKNVRIVGLDMGRLQAGASVMGEFEKRLKGVIDAVKSSPVPTILFIDEAHTLVGSGHASGNGDGANLLKPALARGEMRTIAATTWSEYKKYFEKDAALARRFQLVKLDEPSLEETVAILRGIVPSYEKTHKVYVRDDAVIKTAELAGRYISGRQLPDKAIDVLDTACARVRVSLGAKPSILETFEEKQAAALRELAALERDRLKGIAPDISRDTALRHAELQALLQTLTANITDITARWEKEKFLVANILALRTGEKNLPRHNDAACTNIITDPDAAPEMRETADAKNEPLSMAGLTADLYALQGDEPLVFFEVSPELVTGIVAEWTGIPAGRLGGARETTLTSLGDRLRKRVRGQDYALAAIEKAVISAHAGLDSPTRPTGIFLLVGPSGVGKTETALAVADELFGGERMLVSINMSEFQEKHTISRLIGSPPGYVGYGEGGRLTEAVRRQPYSAVLFDEVEKAHPDVVNLFYQIFDKGILADGEGREIDFKNTVIFLTSNLGSEVIAELCDGETPPDPVELHEAIRPALSRFFRPALLGRMTIVPYTTIRPSILKELVIMKLSQIKERMQIRHGVSLEWENAVIETISDSCTAVDTGARNIDHIINANLLPGMASTLLGRGGKPGRKQTLTIGLDTDGANFTYVLQ
jgi:type VI secretion system protein VasG